MPVFSYQTIIATSIKMHRLISAVFKPQGLISKYPGAGFPGHRHDHLTGLATSPYASAYLSQWQGVLI